MAGTLAYVPNTGVAHSEHNMQHLGACGGQG